MSELRYLPFGETRWMSGTTPTDRRFTGQREVPAIGLYDYNARMYWPAAGRFVSADTVVPELKDPQAFNRYAYVRNSPLTRVDPSGNADQQQGSSANSFWASFKVGQINFKLQAKWINIPKLEAALKKTSLGIKLLSVLSKVDIGMTNIKGGVSLPADKVTGRYTVLVQQNTNEADDPEWAALVAHELFHVYQRETAAAGDSRKTEHTSKQFEREAYIFQYAFLSELDKGIFTNPGRGYQTSLQILLKSPSDAYNWLEAQDKNLTVRVYRLAQDDTRYGGDWQKAFQSLNFGASEVQTIKQAAALTLSKTPKP